MSLIHMMKSLRDVDSALHQSIQKLATKVPNNKHTICKVCSFIIKLRSTCSNICNCSLQLGCHLQFCH